MTVWHGLIFPLMRHFRRRRVSIYQKLCPELFDSTARTVLDLGGSQHFWSQMPVDLGLKRVEILNISDSETGHAEGAATSIPVRLYDGTHIPLADGAMDLVMCNSVIEHVPVERRRALVQEMARVGKRVLVQTPALEFPIEPHFVFPCIHWLPRGFGRLLVFLTPWFWLSGSSVARGKAYFDEVRLLSKRDVSELFPGGAMIPERFCALPKSYVIVMNSSSDK